MVPMIGKFAVTGNATTMEKRSLFRLCLSADEMTGQNEDADGLLLQIDPTGYLMVGTDSSDKANWSCRNHCQGK